MKFLIAGFGGQGILFAGKFLAYIGLYGEKEVSWLPSYGPEMRGGTANCSVILADSPIGSPIVDKPEVLMVMNDPSLVKFEQSVEPGGLIFYDSSLVSAPTRSDVTAVGVPATGLAEENGMHGLANMILTGKLLDGVQLCPLSQIEDTLKKMIPERKKDMLDINIRALKLGREYK